MWNEATQEKSMTIFFCAVGRGAGFVYSLWATAQDCVMRHVQGAFKIKLQSANNMNMAIVRNELTFNCLSAFTRTNQACHSKCSIYLL
jgi:hypothetical protein